MSNQTRGRSWMRLMPLLAFIFVLVLADLAFVMVIFHSVMSNVQLAYPAMLGGAFGQTFLIAILGGLWGRTWLDGFMIAAMMMAVACAAIICGQTVNNFAAERFAFLSNGTAFTLPTAFAVVLLLPLYVIGISLGLLGCRHWFGWRLVWGDRVVVRRESGSIEDLLAVVAVIASTLLLGQVAMTIFESNASEGWAPVAIIWVMLTLIGIFLIIPATWSIFLARQRAYTVCGLLVTVALTIIVPLIFVAIAYSQTQGLDFGESAMFVIITCVCAAIVFCTGAALMWFAKFRVVRGQAAHEDDSNAATTNTRVPVASRMSLRLKAAFVLIAAVSCNIGVAQLQAWRERTDEHHASLHKQLADLGGAMAVEDRAIYRVALGPDATDDTLAAFLEARSIVAISLERSEVTTDGLKLLHRFPNLKELNVNGVRLTAEAWDDIKQLTQLESLSIANTGLSVDQLCDLRDFASLSSLDIGELGLTRDELARIQSTTNLTDSLYDLSLRGNRLSDNDLREVLQANVNVVDVSNMPIDGSGLDALPWSHDIDLSGTNVSDKSLRQLLAKINVHALRIRRTDVTDAAIKAILAKGVGEIDVSESKITDAGLLQLVKGGVNYISASSKHIDGRALATCHGAVISNLDLSHSGITNDTLDGLTSFAQISRLSIADTQITNEGLIHLRDTVIYEIDIRDTSITAEGLRKALAGTQSIAGTQLIVVDRDQFTDDELEVLRASTSLRFRFGDAQVVR